jgi:hypothetical protein
MRAKIHWSNSKTVVDDSEPVVGEVVEDTKGMITIRDAENDVYHRVYEATNGTPILKSLRSLGARSRDTYNKGTVDDVEVML